MASHSNPLLKQCTCLLVLTAILATGCSKSTLSALPFFNADSKKEPSFQAMAESGSVELTIWHDSFESAQQASLNSGKPILADFTGSDWCTWCIKLKEDVFETEEFEKWARENVVLLELDYPKRAMQSPDIRSQNKELAERYSVKSYPTVLLLDSDGEVLGKMGYMKTPRDWIEAVQPMVAKANTDTQFR